MSIQLYYSLCNICKKVLTGKYSSLINCSIISFMSFIRILSQYSSISYVFLKLSMIYSFIYYFVDTIKIIKHNKNEECLFIPHHICACQILFSKYIYDTYTLSLLILMYVIELSSVFHNLYELKWINKQQYKFTYIPLRFLSNTVFVYYMLYDDIYYNLLQYVTDYITYTLLFIFNIGGIILCYKL